MRSSALVALTLILAIACASDETPRLPATQGGGEQAGGASGSQSGGTSGGRGPTTGGSAGSTSGGMGAGGGNSGYAGAEAAGAGGAGASSGRGGREGGAVGGMSGSGPLGQSGASLGGVAGASAGATGGSSAAGANGGSSAAGASGGSSTGVAIRNDVIWQDTSNNPIYSQGGGVLEVDGTYYWYGVKYNGAVAYAGNLRQNDDTSFNAVTVYSSRDLTSWKFENDVLTSGGSGSEIAGSSWIGRLGVAYNASTHKYVLVTQYSGSAGTGELFATSDTPTGKFTFDHLQTSVENVANSTTGDQTVFVDDDGSAYVICSSSMGRANLYVAPLRASDYLNVEPATRIYSGDGREGNAMFKYGGRYYFCSSDLHGWNASHTYCISATNIMGPYDAEFVMTNTDADFSHVTQTGFFVTVTGTSGSFVIFAGDRWADFAGNGVGLNQWLPLTFAGENPVFNSLSEWLIDVDAGTFSVGPGNNYALNPSFEADRVTMTQPAGWTASSTSGAAPHTNVDGGHSGNWGWQLASSVAYQATLEQTLTSLPNGTYTLSAWVKSSGGQATADLYAKDFGGSTATRSLATSMSSYTEVSITGILVSNGKASLGVTTQATASQSLTFDDVSFVRVGP